MHCSAVETAAPRVSATCRRQPKPHSHGAIRPHSTGGSGRPDGTRVIPSGHGYDIAYRRRVGQRSGRPLGGRRRISAGDYPQSRSGALRAERSHSPGAGELQSHDRQVGGRSRAFGQSVTEVEYLDLEDLLRLVRLLKTGPVRDIGLLDSAVNRPRSSAFGEDAYPTLALKAAALLPVSYTHLRAHETRHDLVCRL